MDNIEASRARAGVWDWWRGVGFDRDANWLWINGRVITIGPAEGDIVQVIFTKGRASTRTLARAIFGARDDIDDALGTVRTMVAHLRKKIEGSGVSLINLQRRNNSGRGGGTEGLYTFEWD